MPKARTRKPSTAANVGFEAQLWQMADALRGSMDAAEYKHVTLGLLPGTISALRESLLPKLISGEVRRTDAKRFFEGAGA